MSNENNLQDKFTLLSNAHQWIQQKLISGEGFSVLLVSDHPTGKKMTKYHHDTVEKALAHCRAELANELGDATAYAFVFDARTKVNEELKPMLIFQLEQRGDGEATQLAQRYELKKKWFLSAMAFKAQEDFRGLGSGESWLVAGA